MPAGDRHPGEQKMQKMEKLSCCGIDFEESRAYAKHIETAHGPEKLACCGVSFKSAPEFSQHLKSAHGAK